MSGIVVVMVVVVAADVFQYILLEKLIKLCHNSHTATSF